MKKPDLIILVAVWDFLSALGALIAISAIAVFAFPAVLAERFGPTLVGIMFMLSVFVLILLVFLIISLAGGIGLLWGKEWGRLSGIVNATMSLFYLPAGTVVGILILIYLTSPEVRDYFRLAVK